METGRADLLSHMSLTAAMYGAEADLCTTSAERVKVYEKLVEALTALEKIIERQARRAGSRRECWTKASSSCWTPRSTSNGSAWGKSASQPWSRERYERRQ